MRTIGRATLTVVTAALVLASPLAISPASAESLALCTLDAQLAVRPGFRISPTSGSIVSETPGTISCTGVVGGSAVTGPGTLFVNGTYSGTCAAGTSSGQTSYVIPTEDGPKSGVVSFVVTWVAVAGFIVVNDPIYGTGSGPFEFLPVKGNCVTQPVTSIRWVNGQVALNVFPSPAPTPQ